MKLYILLLVNCFLVFVSCGNSSENTEVQKEVVDSTSLYGNVSFVFPALSENAKIYVSQWGAFEDFEVEAKSVNGITVEALREKSERLISRIDSLTKKVPDTLQIQSIVSRVMVAKTRASLLLQEVNKGQIDSLRLQSYLNQMNIATKNLIIQINEKFDKDAIDFQRKDDENKEVEKQKRFLDSVYRSELEDKKVN